MMKKTKEIYSQPTTKLLVVRVEQSILVLSQRGVGGIQNITEDNGDVTDDSKGWI